MLGPPAGTHIPKWENDQKPLYVKRVFESEVIKQIKRGVKEVVKSQINEINERCKMKGCGAMIHPK